MHCRRELTITVTVSRLTFTAHCSEYPLPSFLSPNLDSSSSESNCKLREFSPLGYSVFLIRPRSIFMLYSYDSVARDEGDCERPLTVKQNGAFILLLSVFHPNVRCCRTDGPAGEVAIAELRCRAIA
jgi:hypothetical protein